MRRRFTIPIIAALAVAPWLWSHPDRAMPAVEMAQLLSVVDVPTPADWAGGFSGIEVTKEGAHFYLVTDRGYIARGSFSRVGDVMTALTIEGAKPLVDKPGLSRKFPHTDAEGIALDADGHFFVSFEHVHRVLRYDTWEASEKWPSTTRSWRALSKNGGLEALAVDASGALYTLPEAIAPGATAALVYRRHRNQEWEQPFTIPVDRGFAPVGADFGPDGLLYLLERGLYVPGFHSRVRRMSISQEGVGNIETILTTRLGKHGNLEGLSVWKDNSGAIRLTMVSDGNFLFFMRDEVVEYRVEGGVALSLE